MKVKSCCSLFILFYNKSRDLKELNILKTSLFKNKQKTFFLVSIFPLLFKESQGHFSLLEQLYFAWIGTQANNPGIVFLCQLASNSWCFKISSKEASLSNQDAPRKKRLRGAYQCRGRLHDQEQMVNEIRCEKMWEVASALNFTYRDVLPCSWLCDTFNFSSLSPFLSLRSVGSRFSFVRGFTATTICQLGSLWVTRKKKKKANYRASTKSVFTS